MKEISTVLAATTIRKNFSSSLRRAWRILPQRIRKYTEKFTEKSSMNTVQAISMAGLP